MKKVVENKIEIILPDELEVITSATRESIYFLQSLVTIFNEHIVPKDLLDTDTYSKRIKRIANAKTKFAELEKKLYYPEQSQIKKDGTHKIELDPIEISSDYLTLKEEIDLLQYEILKYLFDIENSIMESLYQSDNELDKLRIKHFEELRSFSMFEHSKDEDKFENYRLYFSDEKWANSYKKENTYPVPIKIRNYDFLIKKYRSLFKMAKKAEVDIISESSKIREEKIAKKINSQQRKISRQMKSFTIWASVLTVIGFLYASYSTYKLYTDNTSEVNKEYIERLENKIEKSNSIFNQQKKSIILLKSTQDSTNRILLNIIDKK